MPATHDVAFRPTVAALWTSALMAVDPLDLFKGLKRVYTSSSLWETHRRATYDRTSPVTSMQYDITQVLPATGHR